MSADFGMHGNPIRPRLHHPGNEHLRLSHHEVNIKGLVRQRPERLDDIRAHGEVGDEIAVHHITVKAVHAGVD